MALPIYPRPQWMRLRSPQTEHLLPPSLTLLSADHEPSAQALQQALAARYGVTLETASGIEQRLLIGSLQHPHIAAALDAQGIVPPSEVYRSGGYILASGTNGVVIGGFDPAGSFYGVQSLLQLLHSTAAPALTLPDLEVHDWPAKPLRGVHLFLPGRGQIVFFKRLLDWLAGLKYNTVFIEVGGGMRFARHPAINTAWERFCATANAYPGGPLALWESQGFLKNALHTELADGGFLEQDEVADLVSYARARQIELVPEVQSLSHAYYLCLAYPELAERADDPYADTYCPSNPRSYAVLFDVLEEVIAVFQPRLVHIGHDEVYHLGCCPRCQGRSGAELLAGDITHIHNWLAARGIRTALWGDRLIPAYSAGYPQGGLARDVRHDTSAGANPRNQEQSPPADQAAAPELMLETYQAIAHIPTDVLILDWYWMYDRHSTDYFLRRGFEVVIGNFGDNFAPQGYDRWHERASQTGVLGGQVSTWCEVSEFGFGYNGCIFNMLFAAQQFWWHHYRDSERAAVAAHIASLMPGTRANLAGTATTPCPPPNLIALPLTAAGPPPPFGPALQLPPDTPFTRPLTDRAVGSNASAPHATLAIGRVITRIYLLHTCTSAKQRVPTWYLDDALRHPASDLLGCYTLHYIDGTSAELPVYYGSQIARWDIPYGEHIDAVPYWADPLPAGVDPAGRRITLYQLCWENPHPHREVAALELSYLGDAEGAIWLLAASACSA